MNYMSTKEKNNENNNGSKDNQEHKKVCCGHHCDTNSCCSDQEYVMDSTNIYNKAIDLLKKNITKYGIIASGIDTEEAESKNYASLFIRDIAACSLGILESQDTELMEGLKKSIGSLANVQSELGQFPFSCRPELGEVRWRFEAGTIDSTVWWCIAFLLYYQKTNDKAFYEKFKPHFLKACLWLRYQDRNQDYLLEQGEAADWADEMPRHGTVLYTNSLYYWLLKLRVELVEDEKEQYEEIKKRVYESFNTIFWIHKESSYNLNYIPDNEFTKTHKKDLSVLEKINSDLVNIPYYIGYISHKNYEYRMDVMGNLIAVYAGLADAKRANKIIDYIFSVGINYPFPVKVLYPIIDFGDKEWKDYMVKGLQNIPHQYHNGAIWPKTTGFWIACLQKYNRPELHDEFASFAELISQADDGFHEYYHGLYGTPMGSRNQSWSIAMFLLGYNLVRLH